MLRAAVLFLIASAVAAADPATVKIADGAVRGVATSQYRSFRGLPYAAPPLGKLRWTPPQPPAPWGGVLDATQYKHNCIQKEQFDPKQPRDTLSEDCLYLNVFTPANATAGSKLPVLFWVHGGGYQGGEGNDGAGEWFIENVMEELDGPDNEFHFIGFISFLLMKLPPFC